MTAAGRPEQEATPRRARGRHRLAFALAGSVLLHLVLLVFVQVQPRYDGRRSALADNIQVVLVPVAPRPVADSSPAPLPAAPAVELPRPVEPAPAENAPQPEAAQASPRPTPEVPPPQPAAMPVPPPVPATEFDQVPRAQALPPLEDLAPRLASRRLTVEFQVEADGSVSRAWVSTYELDPAIARRLEAEISALHFAPAMKEGVAVPATIKGLLCFDDAGLLDQAPSRCLRIRDEPPR